MSYIFLPAVSRLLDLETETSHAALVKVYCGKAVLLGVSGVGEEHALVTLGFFFLADAAGL